MRLRTSLLILGLLTAIAPRALAQEGTEESDPVSLPPEDGEVRGTCETPRQAWLQHLWWAGGWGGERDYVKATACFDTSRLADPASEAPALAQRLLEHLDASNLKIDTKAPATIDPNYVDPTSGRHEYMDPRAPAFVMVKGEDGRWLLSADSLERIPGPGLGRQIADLLPEWFHTDVPLLKVKVWSLLGVLLLIFTALVMQRLTVFVVGTYVRRLVSRSRLTYLKRIVDRADRPIGGLTMAWVFHLGFPLLVFPITVSQVALLATKALAAFSMVWLVYRLIDVLGDWLEAKAAKTETKLDDQLVPLVTKTLKVFTAVLGGIFVLQNLNVNVSSLLAGVGLGGLAFALAAKDTVANFFGSVTIFTDKPFQIGDWVVIAGTEGTVAEVGFRTTRIRTFYDSLVTVPNSIISNTTVDNYGARRYRRYVAKIGLTYDTPPEKMQAFCEAVRAVVAAMPGMRKDLYFVEFTEFADSGIIVFVYVFMEVKTWAEELRLKTNLNLEMLRVAKDLGVAFAFPTRTLHVDGLVRPGESKPGHSGTNPSAEELVAIIESFGPGGARGRPEGLRLSAGYDAGANWNRALERPPNGGSEG